MQNSRYKVNATLEKQLKRALYQLLVDLKSTTDAETVLVDLLSNAELTSISKRLGIAYWLTSGRSYDNIKQNLKVSSATIADIKDHIKKPGWKLAIQKITADEWATAWEARIKSVFKK